MSKEKKIKGSTRNWEKGVLGRDPRYVKRAPHELECKIEESLSMQAMSIRLDRELIETFKQIARIHNMGYQPLMREALRRFADAEIKAIVAAVANASDKGAQHGGKHTVEIKLDDLPRHVA